MVSWLLELRSRSSPSCCRPAANSDATMTDNCPVATRDQHDFPGLVNQRVPGIAAVVDDITYFKEDRSANNLLTDYRANAEVVVMARTEADLGNLPSRPGWHRIEPKVAAWTDDYSDVLRAILRKNKY